MNNFQKMAVFFCMGVFSVQFLTNLPSANFLYLVIGVLLVVVRWLRYLSVYLLGFVWAAAYAQFLAGHQLLKPLEGQETLVVGQVYGLPTSNQRATQFLLHVERVISPIAVSAFPKNIRLNWYNKSHRLRAGDRWQLLVKLKRPHGLANPYGFDYEKWLFQQKIGASGYVRESRRNRRISSASMGSIAVWRESIKDYIGRALQGAEHEGVIKALVLGDRSDISVQQWDVFRRTGTSHLIAISGLHIGLLAGLLFAGVRYVAIRIHCISRWALPLALFFSFSGAALYAALAGFSLPTQRALLMLSLVLLAIYWKRHYSAFHIILVALLGALIYDPLAPMSVGFWLSFAAVAIILFSILGRLTRPKPLVQLLQLQVFIAIGLMPLVVYFFQQVSLVAPLANALAVPWASFVIVPLLLIAMLVALLNDFLSINILQLANTLLDYQWTVLKYLAELEFSNISFSHVSWVAGLAAMLGGLLLLLPRGFIAKPLLGVFFIPLFWPIPADRLTATEFSLTLLDVGQGLAVVIQTREHTLVFDTGAKYSDKGDLASMVVMPYLSGEGIAKVDRLVISHGDNDHAGGAETVLAGLSVDELYTSVPDKFPDHAAINCQQGQRWKWDGVDFEFLSPVAETVFEGNNASCVLKVSSINGAALLTGDIEKPVERSMLLYQRAKLESAVLIAPHHGSRTSSTAAFIDAVNPQYVLFASGYRNRFGFPKKEVLSRYQKRAVTNFNTANDGAIQFRFLIGQAIELRRFRQQHSMFWSWRE